MENPQDTDVWENDDAQTMAFGPDAPTSGWVRRHFLVVVSGPEPGRRIELTEQSISLGRKSQADVRLLDPKVSGVHCRAQLRDDQLWIEDLRSTNGTFVDGRRIGPEQVADVGALINVGAYVLKHEVLTVAELERTQERESDLRAAADYVRSLLPPPLTEGPLRTDWVYLPSTALGGDAFGYQQLPDGRFAIYLLDVCGHGTGPAMHSVSVLNVLSQGALPDTDLREPGAVLGALNRFFSMEGHAGMYFTCWYGVFDPRTRELRFASGGHPPAFLVREQPVGRTATPLQTHNPGIGLFPEAAFRAESVGVPSPSRVYLYSDGAYEFRPKGQDADWSLEDLKRLLTAPPEPGLSEAKRIHRGVAAAAGNELRDDFSLLVVEFP